MPEPTSSPGITWNEPVVRVGKYVRVPATALNQWVDEHEKSP